MKALAAPRPPPPPTKATTVCTSGLLPMIFTNCCSRVWVIWNELDWSACSPPIIWPVSSSGKKPLGTMV